MKKQLVNWIAEVFIFSGRPNPQWKLSEKQIAAWIKLWDKAALSDAAVLLPSRLGYTGCRLQYNEHSHWIIYNGCVSFFNGKNVISKADEGRQMEIFLLHTIPNDLKDVLKSLPL